MNIIELQDSLKDLPDSALMKEMQMPTGSAPQFLVLSELKRRKRMRDEFQRQQNSNMPTVAEEVVTAAGMPQEGIMGAARAIAPNTNVAQNTGMDMAAPVPATRAPQPQMMADGGILRYAPGGSVGRPVEPFPANSPNPRDRSNWMAMYKDTHNLDGSPKSLSPDVAQSEGIAALSADVEDYMAPGMRMTTQDKLSAALGDVDRRVPRSLPMISSPEDQDVVRSPEVEAAMETQNVLEEMMKANQGLARDETPTGQLNVDALGNVLGFNPEDPTVGGEALRLAEASMTDAPLDIERSNLDAQMGTQRIGIGTDPSIRDTLPEVVREDDLRFSRGTASSIAPSAGSNQIADMIAGSKISREYGGIPLADMVSEMSGNAPIDFDASTPDPLQGLSLSDQMIALGFTGGDIDPTRFPTAEERELAGQISAIDAFGDYLVSPKMGPDAPQVAETTGAITSLIPGVGAPLATGLAVGAGAGEGSVTTDSEPYRGPVSGMTLSEKFADPVEATRRLFGLGASKDIVTTQNEASVVDTAATEDLVTEEAKVESDDKKSPTIRPKLRPADLLTPTGPSGPSGSSGLSGADLSIASMLEARKKEAEADKWMALAYAGMELMKPTATIGEGLGKAGQAGLGYLTKSKKGLQDFETDMLKLQTQRDIANIRAAASGSRSGNKLPTGSSLMTYLSGKLEDLNYERLLAAQQKNAPALTRIDAEIGEVERQIAEVVSTGTFTSGRNNNNGDDVVRDYDVNK